MFAFFLNILRQKSGRYVCVQLLQTLNILFENISHETSLCKCVCVCVCVCVTRVYLPMMSLDFWTEQEHNRCSILVMCIYFHMYDV